METLRRTLKMTLFLGLLLAALTGWGQPQGWHYNAGGRLLGVKSRGNNIWVVGAQGLILHSTDRGDTWNIRESGTQNTLRGVSFIDDLRGWVVGDNDYDTATVLRTTDGGINWQIQASLRTRWGYGITFVDSFHGWICGPIDTIYKTTDGGATWTKHPMNRGNHGNSICFTDSLRGWVSIDNGLGAILKTTDGGLTWVFKSSSGGSLEAIDMLDSLTGWGAGGVISKTTDGWETRTILYVAPGYLLGISLGDSLYVWSVGGNSNVDRAMIVSTTSGGALWTMDTSRTRNNVFYDVYGHLQPTNITVVGNGGAIVRSTNAGTTWRVYRNADIKDQSFYNTVFYDSQMGWAVGTNGVIAHTTNGGTVWQRQVSGLFSFLYGVDFPSSQTGWICTEGGGILKTTNAGNVWFGQNSGTTYPLFSIDFPDSDTLYGVGVGGYYGPPNPVNGEWLMVNGKEQTTLNGEILPLNQVQGQNDTLRPWGTGYDFWKWPWRPQNLDSRFHGNDEALYPQTPYRAIVRTTNGGALWTAQNTSGQVPLYGVSFATPAEGWACGDPQGGMGVILHTTDSGATWTGQTSNVNQTLNWIQFRGTQNGWCVGSGGTALWTTDGGSTWNQGNTGTTAVLWSCGFYDDLHGFACGNNGLLIKTTDGGRNWTPDTSKVYANLMAVNALDSTHAWSVGSYGMVLGWREAGTSGIEQESTGAGELRVKNGIKAWPNPFVSYARVPGREKDKFALYDVTGRKVGMYPGNQIGMNVPAGVYFLMAENKGSAPVRVVKIR